MRGISKVMVVLGFAAVSAAINSADQLSSFDCIFSTCTGASQYCATEDANCTFCFAVGSQLSGYCAVKLIAVCNGTGLASCGVLRGGTCNALLTCAGSTPLGGDCDVITCDYQES